MASRFDDVTVTAEVLRSLLSYSPDTGDFSWLVSRGPVRAGSRAGAKNSRGYVQISINHRLYKAHRLAWLYTHGVWPSGEIDHIDGNKENNRLSNLRDASRSQNQHNRGALSNNKSGFKGVSYYAPGKQWLAAIRLSGRRIHIGYFDTADEAHAAYCVAAERLHGEFARTS